MEIIKANEAKRITNLALDRIRKQRIDHTIECIDKEIRAAAGNGSTFAVVKVDFDLRKPVEAILAASGFECGESHNIDEQGLLRIGW